MFEVLLPPDHTTSVNNLRTHLCINSSTTYVETCYIDINKNCTSLIESHKQWKRITRYTDRMISR